jgi:hypothetical protein
MFGWLVPIALGLWIHFAHAATFETVDDVVCVAIVVVFGSLWTTMVNRGEWPTWTGWAVLLAVGLIAFAYICHELDDLRLCVQERTPPARCETIMHDWHYEADGEPLR